MKVTEFLAIYAAALSTTVFLWNLSRSRSRIAVKLVLGVSDGAGEVQSGAYIAIQNVSPHTVHLSSLSILYPYRNANLIDKVTHLFRYRRLPRTVGWVHTKLDYFSVEDKLPISLEARQSHHVFVPDPVLDRILHDAIRREIRANVQDALWRSTYSGRLRVTWSTTGDKCDCAK